MTPAWQVLENSIPRGAAERIANILNCSTDYVRRWRREPLSDESPAASGQRSPLDRVCDLIDAIFLVNPKGAAPVVEFVINHHRALTTAQIDAFRTDRDRAEASAELLTETTQAVNALNVEGSTANTLQQLVEMRDAADRAISRLQVNLRDDGEGQQ